ncbi:hypothetical protein GGR34_001984 [Microvirga flocculans]|uniref:Uncharacterized protein n=1 Tax=Microvirga flocculans TaxID=217168 RepID=A0A7W6IFR7_9HYPH|nr:hypothetical protein [Microvirga flocculans]MBB4040331.1 hypothetical protein [Microvirga flocculans]
MPELGFHLRFPARLLGSLTLAVPFLFALTVNTAQAQGLLNFFKAIFQPPAPVSQPQFLGNEPGPAGSDTKRQIRSRPKPVAAENEEVRKPIEPRPPGQFTNPVAALLSDSTLRPGDMVMFPDGLRVFTGRVGQTHKLNDFKPIAQMAKGLSRSTRKLVSGLLPGDNVTWNTSAVPKNEKVASKTTDVATTGSVKKQNPGKDPKYP